MWWMEKLTVVLLIFLSVLLYAHGASVLRTKDLNETNSLLSSIHSEIPEECDCGVYGVCHFEDGYKICTCAGLTAELDGKCIDCNCGDYSKSCRYNLKEDKICDCFPGYEEDYGTCELCNCGPYGSCSFEDGQKRCHCLSFAVEMNGVCVECYCGRLGRCTFEYGRKKCICDSLTWEKNGKCVECDCGKNTKSCHFDWKGDKACNCTSGYAQVSGICEDCKCGVNSRSCFFRDNGIKVCNCDFGYIETNGYCSAICNEDKCIHGKCEIVGNGFKCRCNEGFTGQRCEEKIQTKSKKQNLWMVLVLSGVFAIVVLLSCMFCFLTRILNKMSKK